MKIAVLAAVQTELEATIQQLQNAQKQSVRHQQYTTGQVGRHEVAVMLTGIGKVNAALNTTAIVEAFQPDYVIDTGSAGGLANHLNVGDVVLADQLVYCDVDNRSWGYRYGQVPGMSLRYEVDQDLLQRGLAVSKSLTHFETVQGLITSSDSFITDSQARANILEHFPEVCAVDMESCAVAQVCSVLQQPYLIARAISDDASDSATEVQDANLALAGKHSADWVVNFLQAI